MHSPQPSLAMTPSNTTGITPLSTNSNVSGGGAGGSLTILLEGPAGGGNPPPTMPNRTKDVTRRRVKKPSAIALRALAALEGDSDGSDTGDDDDDDDDDDDNDDENDNDNDDDDVVWGGAEAGGGEGCVGTTTLPGSTSAAGSPSRASKDVVVRGGGPRSDERAGGSMAEEGGCGDDRRDGGVPPVDVHDGDRRHDEQRLPPPRNRKQRKTTTTTQRTPTRPISGGDGGTVVVASQVGDVQRSSPAMEGRRASGRQRRRPVVPPGPLRPRPSVDVEVIVIDDNEDEDEDDADGVAESGVGRSLPHRGGGEGGTVVVASHISEVQRSSPGMEGRRASKRQRRRPVVPPGPLRLRPSVDVEVIAIDEGEDEDDADEVAESGGGRSLPHRGHSRRIGEGRKKLRRDDRTSPSSDSSRAAAAATEDDEDEDAAAATRGIAKAAPRTDESPQPPRARYPVGCPVWYNVRHLSPCSGILAADAGVVRSVAFDTHTRMTMYEVKREPDSGMWGIGLVEYKDAVVAEEDIAFAIGCPVLVTMKDDRDVDSSEMGGEIINVMPAVRGRRGGERSFIYSVLIPTTEESSVLMMEDVPPGRIRYRYSLRALQSMIRDVTSSSPRKCTAVGIRSNGRHEPMCK